MCKGPICRVALTGGPEIAWNAFGIDRPPSRVRP